MKTIIKKYYRDIATGILMTISFAITFFVAFECTKLINSLMDELDKDNAFVSEIYADFQFKNENDLTCMLGEDVLEKLHSGNGTVIAEMYADIGDYGVSMSVEYVISDNVAMPYELEDGAYPDEKFTNGCVLVTPEVLEYAEKKSDGKYIKIADVNYKICGILKSSSMMGNDGRILLYVDGMKSKEQYLLLKRMRENLNTISLLLGSDRDAEEVLRELNYNFEENEVYLQETDRTSNVIESDIYTSLGKFVYPCIMLFCIFNVYEVTGLWISQRKEETAIKKAFGKTDSEILNGLLLDMLKCLLPGFVLALAGQLIYRRLSGYSMSISEYFTNKGIWMCVFVVLVNIAILYRYAKKIKKTETINSLHSK